MVGQAERQLERPLGNALMQVSNAFIVAVTLAASDGQDALFHLQVQVLFLEASGSNDDSIVVFAMFFDVVGWVAATRLVTRRGFEQVIETVETYGMTEQWSQRKSSSHDTSPENQRGCVVARPDFGIAYSLDKDPRLLFKQPCENFFRPPH
ncbi:hypothetical protein D3C79_617700 [compost metagenome]